LESPRKMESFNLRAAALRYRSHPRPALIAAVKTPVSGWTHLLASARMRHRKTHHYFSVGAQRSGPNITKRNRNGLGFWSAPACPVFWPHFARADRNWPADHTAGKSGLFLDHSNARIFSINFAVFVRCDRRVFVIEPRPARHWRQRKRLCESHLRGANHRQA
jgi:hypothetical protein